MKLVISFALIAIAASLTQAAPTPDPAAPITKSFVYKKIGPTELELVIHYPPGWKESDKRPAIVFFFGGGWTNGTIQAFESQASYFASRGMVAARADYRVKSRQGVAPKECVEDAKSAVRWLRQNAGKLGVDPDRIVAAGGSAGGHIAACTTLTPGLDAAGEDTTISCKANVLVLYNPVLQFGPQMAQRIGNDDALAKAISPTLHLEKKTPPTLLLYGTEDWLLNQGNEFMKRSKELGHHAELFTAEGQQHGFYNKPEWKEKTTHRVAEFLVSVGYLSDAKGIAFEIHDGYFVSNQFEPEMAVSFVVIQDQKAFDAVFGMATVMNDKAHHLPPGAFDSKMVLAAIKRGKAVWAYKVDAVTVENGVVNLRYAATSEAHPTATFASPLIVSIPRGSYTAYRFLEDGKVVQEIGMNDPIDHLAEKLSANPLWENGMDASVPLPADAPIETVLAKVFTVFSFDQGRATGFKILEAKQVRIKGSLPNRYTAVRVSTNVGEKIVLIWRQEKGDGWWGRVYDSEGGKPKADAQSATKP